MTIGCGGKGIVARVEIPVVGAIDLDVLAVYNDTHVESPMPRPGDYVRIRGRVRAVLDNPPAQRWAEAGGEYEWPQPPINSFYADVAVKSSSPDLAQRLLDVIAQDQANRYVELAAR